MVIYTNEKCTDKYGDESIGTDTTTTVHIKPPGGLRRGSDEGFGLSHGGVQEPRGIQYNFTRSNLCGRVNLNIL